MGKTQRYDRDWEPGERRASGWSREDGVIEMDIPEPPAPAPTFSVRSRDAAAYVLAVGGTLVAYGFAGGCVFLNPNQTAKEAFQAYQYGNPVIPVHRYVDAARLVREAMRIGSVTDPVRLVEGDGDGHGHAA